MFEAFDAIFNFIQTIVTFIAGLIENIVFVITQIVQGFATATYVVTHLPDIAKLFASAMLAFAIVINLIHLGK